jgi:hypothetical protein
MNFVNILRAKPIPIMKRTAVFTFAGRVPIKVRLSR